MILMSQLIKEGGKLFGSRSSRVTTEEMNYIFNELKNKLSKHFKKFNLSKALSSKQDHGDVDIIALPLTDWKTNIEKILKSSIVDKSSNSGVHSYLINFPKINKNVHVDFIVTGNDDKFQSMSQYYSYNDFSGIVGIFSKKLHFKYGSSGFFKRFKDRRGNYHDILISSNLMDGLKILGLNPTRFNNISDVDDMVDYLSTSKLFDFSFITSSEMNQSDRKSMKRPVIDYVINKLREKGAKSSIKDEDYYFKKYYPKKYQEVEIKKQEIDNNLPIRSKYNGQWLMDKLGVKPGPQIGRLLKILSDKYGNNLVHQSDSEVLNFIKNYIS